MATVSDGVGVGRPQKLVDKDQLELLRSLLFTWDEIAALLGVSSKTIQRRAKEWNIKIYSSISDADLDRVIGTIISQFPQSGEVMLSGHLRALKVYT